MTKRNRAAEEFASRPPEGWQEVTKPRPILLVIVFLMAGAAIIIGLLTL